MIERLFDFVRERCEAVPDSTMLAAKEGGAWRTYTTREVWETSCSISRGLIALGIDNTLLTPEGMEKIAIISPNCPEWIITDIAVQLSGAALTPIYPTIAPTELAFVLNEAGVRKVFIADESLYHRFAEALQKIPSITHVFTFEEVVREDTSHGGTENTGHGEAKTTYALQHWQALRHPDVTPDETVITRIGTETLATIIYTSGTTGSPKGVMLSHRNIVSNVLDSMPVFTFAKEDKRALSFLPLNHIFERMVTYVFIHSRLQIWYAESMDTIGDNLREVKPMVFTTVPRLLEKVYERIMDRAMELTGIKKALFFWALNLANKYDNVRGGGAWYQAQLALANKLVFSKWREALGGNVKAIVSGSAALQEGLIRIFTAARIIIMEGYGLTETSPVITVNRFESEGRRIGSVGPLIRNVEVKLGEDGEILCKGPNIMMGYYKRAQLTAEVMTDGWFHTGDIGQWVEDRFLKITDRKKEMFKTSGGKYVAPQVVENAMRQSPYIEQIIVIGAGRKFVSALIVPNFHALDKWLKDSVKGQVANHDAIIQLPEVLQLFRKELDKYNKGLGNVEQIKKFKLLPSEWTIASGDLTPKLSMRRKVIERNFSGQIEEMYD